LLGRINGESKARGEDGCTGYIPMVRTRLRLRAAGQKSLRAMSGCKEYASEMKSVYSQKVSTYNER
jgi:hypothetical protein